MPERSSPQRQAILKKLAGWLGIVLLFAGLTYLATQSAAVAVVWNVPVALALGIIIYYGRLGGWIVLVYSTTPWNKPKDISDQHPRPSPVVQAQIETLTQLGFRRLGEAKLKLPLTAPGKHWILIDTTGTITAAVYDQGPVASVIFSTTYPDGSVVETGYPTGEQIESPDFCSQTVSTNVPEAYAVHTRQMLVFSKQRQPTPERLEHMAGYLQWEAIYRQRFTRRKMQTFLTLGSVQFVALVYAALLVGMTLVLNAGDHLSRQQITQAQWSLFWKLAPAAAISCGWTFYMFGQMAKHSRRPGPHPPTPRR